MIYDLHKSMYLLQTLKSMLSAAVYVHWAGRFFAVGKRQAARMERCFRGLFELSPTVSSIVCNLLLPKLPKCAQPFHHLSALHFLQSYSIEHVNDYIWVCTQNIFRKWCWIFVKIISFLEEVRIWYSIETFLFNHVLFTVLSHFKGRSCGSFLVQIEYRWKFHVNLWYWLHD